MSVQKWMGTIANLVEIKAREKFNHRHRVGIPRIKFSGNADIGQIGHLWMGTNELDSVASYAAAI